MPRQTDDWRKSKVIASRTRAASGGSSRRWFRSALVVGALFGSTAALLFFIWPDPDPVLLAIPVTEYTDKNWPSNPCAEADARGLREHFKSDSAVAFQSQDKPRILRELGSFADQSHSRRGTAAFYLSILGAASDSRPYLLPIDARPEDPSTWMTLDELLQPLRRSQAQRLLILDVRPVSSPRSVLPTEDVNELLGSAFAKLEQAGDLPFTVLLANTPCRGANVIRPMKRTAFGLALAQAAGGAADGWNDSRSTNGRVSISELAAYVREVTPVLSTAYGHPQQVPRVFGPASDAVLLHVPAAGPPPLPQIPEPEPYPEFLREAWKDRSQWVASGRDRRAPRLVHHFTLAAMRAEQRWLAGSDPARVSDQFLTLATDLREASNKFPAPSPLVRSVARIRANPKNDLQTTRAALEPILNRISDPGGVKDEELKQMLAPLTAKPAELPPYPLTAAVLFNAAVNLEDPTPEKIRKIAMVAAGFRPKMKQPEMLALDLIAGLPAQVTKHWPAEGLRVFLLTVQTAEEAAVLDGRCLPWVRDQLNEADTIRRQAQKKLCDPETRKDTLPEAVAQLNRACESYRNVRDASKTLKEALAEYEESRAVLVDLAMAFPHDLDSNPESTAKTWSALVEDILGLQRLLRPPAKPSLPSHEELARLGRLTQSARSNRLNLRLSLVVPEKATPAELALALTWPGWTDVERAVLLARYESVGREAVSRMLSAWPTQPSGQEPGTPPRCSPRMAAAAVRDLRRIIDLLRLSETEDSNAIDLIAKTKELGENPEPRDVAALVDRARLAWRQKLADEYRAAEPRRQAVLGWVVTPDEVPAASRDVLPELSNPELPRVREAEKAYHLWLGETHYRGDAAAFASIASAAPYCKDLDELARDFLYANP